MKNLKKFLMNPWVVGVGTGIILLVITSIYDFINKKKVFSSIVAILCFIYKGIIAILNIKIKVWHILIAIIVIMAVIYIVLKIAEKTEPDTKGPQFLEYKEDILFKYKWRWSWGKNYDGTYTIKNLHPVCLKCDTPLPREVFYSGRHTCIRCGYNQCDRLPDMENVDVLIRDNVRRKYISKE